MLSPLLLPFESVSETDFARIGGKASTLARLLQSGYPVPTGAALGRPPVSATDWEAILAWWKRQGSPMLAVRSSGIDEDSKEHSFAGQHRTFLEVKDESSLRSAIEGCYASAATATTAAYRGRLTGAREEPHSASMGVALQRLVQPRFAGVYFTRDPRGGASGLLEVVRGFGESLVSGHETPIQIVPGQPLPPEAVGWGWEERYSEELFSTASRMKATLAYEADIEWAIDGDGKLWILQARPITTLSGNESRAEAEAREVRRLAAANSPDTLWDGQTFAEWTGVPTPLSFGIWRRAFTRSGALGQALHDLGYAGSESREVFPHESVLDSVFARPYVNLSRMESLYFGATPYVMVPGTRPHLAFRWRKLTLRALLNCLPGTWRMIRVAWRLGTGRREILATGERALGEFLRSNRLPNDPGVYAAWDASSLRARFDALSHQFSDQVLVEPLKLMVAIESAQQALVREIGEAQLGEWLGTRLRLPSVDLATEFARAAADSKLRAAFLARYGHRGPGELDLAQPRWAELGDHAFTELGSNAPLRSTPVAPTSVPRSPQSVREKMAEDDWAILAQLLEMREHWKDALLGVYAHLRWIALELGKRTGWGEDIFWLKPGELVQVHSSSVIIQARQRALIARRKARHAVLRQISLPLVFSLQDLEPARVLKPEKIEKGEALSGGIAYGEVRLVSDPTQVDWSRWPENAVLVAENTDPGWTPLFVKARAVVTERGGALSHCAIVAREMGLPAVSGVRGCMSKFKEGEHVWVDGTRGLVTRG